MKVYIAAPFQLQAQGRALRDTLRSVGIIVTSRWLDVDPDKKESSDEAAMDLTDVGAADAVVLINPQDWQQRGGGGRHFECGYAAALGIPLIILGVRSNVFHRIPSTVVCGGGSEVIACLKAF